MKYIVIIAILVVSLFGQENSVEIDPSNIIEVKDTSGLSEKEVRKISNDAVKKKFFQTPWEEMSPTPKNFDWVQTTKGEWFKGTLEAMYNDKLEFDSEEVGDYTFDFDDISQIRSSIIIGVNIEDYAIFSGIIRLKDGTITITQGDKVFKFKKIEIVSLAPDSTKELSHWKGKIDLGMDTRRGNKNQYDYTLQAHVKRRTSMSNLYFDYIGRISSKDNEKIANDHRLQQKYDRYITKNFFWTPLNSEYYQDEFQNIKHQVTAGFGLGYTLVKNSWAEWSVSSGPAYTYLENISAKDGDITTSSPAFDISTKIELELTKRLDFKYDYKLTFSNKDTGAYKHHMVGKIETEITSWLDLDFTLIWDYLQDPKEADDGVTPFRSDYQFVVSLGVEF